MMDIDDNLNQDDKISPQTPEFDSRINFGFTNLKKSATTVTDYQKLNSQLNDPRFSNSPSNAEQYSGFNNKLSLPRTETLRSNSKQSFASTKTSGLRGTMHLNIRAPSLADTLEENAINENPSYQISEPDF